MGELPPLRQTKGASISRSLIVFIFILTGATYFIFERTSKPPSEAIVNDAATEAIVENEPKQTSPPAQEVIASPHTASGTTDQPQSQNIPTKTEASQEGQAPVSTKHAPAMSSYVSHKGDTLKKIALRLYGKADSVSVLAKKNPTIKLKQILPAGIIILLPVELKVAPQK